MSTLAVILIIIGAVLLLLLLVRPAMRKARQRTQVRENKRAELEHHEAQAESARVDAAVADERARRQVAEAELHEERAARRAEELGENR
jgi:FtsZ-interacting cell division protein ZipA